MRLALLALAALVALHTLGRRLRVEPAAPASTDDIEWLESFRIAQAWEGPIGQMPPGRWAYPRHEVN